MSLHGSHSLLLVTVFGRRKWNLTQVRWFSALTIEKVWLQKRMHMPKGLWNAAIGYHDRDLMERPAKESPEVPVILGAPQAGAGVALNGVVEVGEAQRIVEEENGSIVSNDVPITLLGVELERCSVISHSASAAPRSPAAVEKRAKTGVCLPTVEKMAAFVCCVMLCVVVKVP
jgi:hypothetical protein